MSRTTTIGQICRVITGKLDANASSQNGAYPFFTCSINPLRIDTFAYDLECVLIAGNGDLNVKYYKGKFNAYQRTYIVSLKDGVNDVSVKFLHAFFLLYVDVLRKKSVGSTIKYIRLGDITEAAIVIPSFSEQQRIVDILDQEFAKIDVLKANAEKSLRFAMDLFQASVQKAFQHKNGWTILRLEDICATFADGDWIEKKDQAPSGIRLIQTGNVGEGVFRGKDESRRYISSETFERLHCTEIFPGDILISRLPEPIGRGCIIPDTGERMITAVDCTIIRLDARINPEYFVFYTHNFDYKRSVDKVSTGSTRQRISRKNLGDIQIPVPSLAEQLKVVGTLKAISERTESLKSNYSRTIVFCEDLKQALLRKAFNGEL